MNSENNNLNQNNNFQNINNDNNQYLNNNIQSNNIQNNNVIDSTFNQVSSQNLNQSNNIQSNNIIDPTFNQALNQNLNQASQNYQFNNNQQNANNLQSNVDYSQQNVVNSSKNDNNNKKINKIILASSISAIIVIIILFILFLNPNSNKSIVGKSNNVEKSFSSKKYSLIYDKIDFSDKYWQEKYPNYDAMTNKDYFINKYTFKVLGQSETTIGGNLYMPLQPTFSMYYRVFENDYDKSCEYFIKIDFNKNGIFYPNMIIGSLAGINYDNFNFYILDNRYEFNLITGGFVHSNPSSKDSKEDVKVIYDKDNWQVSTKKINSSINIYINYFINKSENDYVIFETSLSSELDDSQIKEFVNKFIENISIKLIDDIETKKYLANLNPLDYYVKLPDDYLEFSDNLKIKSKDINVRLWSSSDLGSLDNYFSSTNNVNTFQWYDKKWRDGYYLVSLYEYVDGVDNGIDAITKSYFGSNSEIENYTYNNMQLKMVHRTNDNYIKTNNYSDVVGFSFELDNNVYIVGISGYFDGSVTVDKFLKYLFDTLLITKK